MMEVHSKRKKQKKMIFKIEKIADFCFISEKNSKINERSVFLKNAQQFFTSERFDFNNNQFDHNGMEKFLKEKEECMKEMDLDDKLDSVDYIKNKKVKRKYINNRVIKNTLFSSSSSSSVVDLIKDINSAFKW